MRFRPLWIAVVVVPFVAGCSPHDGTCITIENASNKAIWVEDIGPVHEVGSAKTPPGTSCYVSLARWQAIPEKITVVWWEDETANGEAVAKKNVEVAVSNFNTVKRKDYHLRIVYDGGGKWTVTLLDSRPMIYQL